jgi:hypothetical protein
MEHIYEPSKFAVLNHFKSFGTKYLGKRWSRDEWAVEFFTPPRQHETERGFLAAWAAAAAQL